MSIPPKDDSSELLEAQALLDCDDPAALLQAVEIQTEEVEGRQRRISASLAIPHPPEIVWQVLSDYEALPKFIPNLASSKRLVHPQGGIRLEQIGTQKLLRINFSARVVLDMEERFPEEIRFKMVEGDFRDFSGNWQLKPHTLNSLEGDAEGVSGPQAGTNLIYSVLVWPKRTMPVKLIEHRICKDLRLNLLAIRQQVVELFGDRAQILTS